MDLVRSDDGGEAQEAPDRTVVRRRPRWQRILAISVLALLLLIVVALAAIWIARRPIVSNIIEREFERRGVEASYDLERVGLRTQVIRNLVIGDPQDPDLTARYAQVQLRIKWDGSIEVYRVVARGVRLEGRVVDGRVSWGQLDKLLPPPSGQPFRFPNIVLDIADSSISLQTPAGPLGFAVRGSGNLTGGFEGRLAAASPGLNLGECRLEDMSSMVGVEIVARRPRLSGPLTADRFACPQSDLVLDQPRFVIDSRFSEGFDSFDGRGQIAAQRIIAGENGLAQLIGNVSFEGTPASASGEIDLAARRSRLGPITAERTRVKGDYRIGASDGTLTLVGEFAAEDANVRQMVSGATGALSGLANTPIGPIATAIGRAIERGARSVDATGDIRVVNAPSGGAARISSARVRTDSGGRIVVDGGQGVTYYWPSGELKLDARIRMAGGGLPTGTVELRQERPGGPLSGVARLEPYTVGDSRLALQPLRFTAAPDGSTQFSTVAELSGSFQEGRVRGLQLPVSGRIGPDGSLRIGQNCIVARFESLRFRDLQLRGSSVPICPVGDAIISQSGSGSVEIGARLSNPDFTGTLGKTPIRIAGDTARISGKEFALTDARLRLGDAPVVFTAERLDGTFRGSGISGTFIEGEATIGNVPIELSDIDADWQFRGGDLYIDGSALVSDRADPSRFYPLRSNDLSFVLSGNDIRTTGTLRHPESGTPVTDVTISHDLGSGAGQAVLDVPGLTFGEGLQPDELTRLTEGVVALVDGTVTGQGVIRWDEDGEVTSTGEFSTAGMDLAAPFGPVTDLSTTIRFTDLLGLETAPGQVATVGSINPGILVEDGQITYQILPDQLVRIQRGIWPFMGGTLILQETVLNFGRPGVAKRLTFQVIGFDAQVFLDRLEIEGIEITGTFDGVLPMIFDDQGGRIVGGRLDSRPPGGTFEYTGTKPDAGLMAGAAFELLSDLRYRHMIVRLDGDLAGEFATRVTIEGVRLGEGGGLIGGLVRRAFRGVPLRVNLNISGPFRALIATARAFKDPTDVIAPVLSFPIDSPSLEVETQRIEKDSDQTRETPLPENIEVESPTESER